MAETTLEQKAQMVFETYRTMLVSVGTELDEQQRLEEYLSIMLDEIKSEDELRELVAHFTHVP